MFHAVKVVDYFSYITFVRRFVVGVPNKPVVIPVMLTKKERKKIRKQRRREVELEKQEKIRFGFIDKPDPKGILQDTCTEYCYILLLFSSHFQFNESTGNRSRSRPNEDNGSSEGTDSRETEVSSTSSYSQSGIVCGTLGQL